MTSRASMPFDVRRTILRALKAYGGESARIAAQFVGSLPVDVISPREIEIMRLIAKGYSNQEIADELHNMERTVRSHISSILAKLHLRNRVEITLFALKHGIAVLDEDDEFEMNIAREGTDDVLRTAKSDEENIRSMFADSIGAGANGLS